VRGEIPAERIKTLYHWDDRNEDEYFEVKKVIGHRGPINDREYLVVWIRKGQNEWVHELDFDSYDCVREYWKQIANEDGREGANTPPLVVG
jgi:hypothetical protein